MSSLLAYVDESLRPGRYLMCVVLVEPADAGRQRTALNGLRLPRQRRLHFQKESRSRRKQLLREVALLDVTAAVFCARLRRGEPERAARDRCLGAIVDHLQSLGRHVTIYIKRREGRDHEDHRALDRARRLGAEVDYHHVLPSDDPLVWLPDCFVWAAGAGGEWVAIVRPVIGPVRNVP